jgi:N-acetylglucosamine kinase-like BadF-type ATPase
MPIYLGLDCGGSSTRALALNEAGEPKFSGQGGAANVASTPDRRIRRSLAQACREAPKPDFICGCFAGLLTPEDRNRAISYIEELFPSAKIFAEPDFAAALFASEPGTDICVVSGTGSLVSSFHDGKVVKSGGRGFILGDEGSAFQYGRDTFLHYLNNPDSASTEVKSVIERVFEFEDEPRILSKLYRTGSPAMLIAKLAKACAVDAHHNEAYAIDSLDRNSEALAGVIHKHIDKFHAGQPKIVISLAGGLWQSAGIYREKLLEKLGARLPNVEFELNRIKKPPVMGAVQLAIKYSHGH